MKVIYDAIIFQNQTAGGISRYHYELFKGGRVLGHEVKIAGLFVKNQYLLSDKQQRQRFVNDPAAIFALFNKQILKHALKKLKSDEIFHPANAYEYLSNRVSSVKNMVFTIHDMIVEKQNMSLGADKLHFARNARKIIAVSESTKNDIVDLFGIDGNKIEVIYHGSSISPQIATKPQMPIPDDFLLYVGDRNGYKNFQMFVTSIASMLKRRSELYLVCAGKRGFSDNETVFFRDLGIEKKIVCLVKITDNELAYLYDKARAFVFPSLNEGFGIPILEAWSCKTPVILSDNNCFREIAADAGEFFDPYCEESIRETVDKVISDKILQKELIMKGTRRLQFFSWEKTVNQTYKLYKSLL